MTAVDFEVFLLSCRSGRKERQKLALFGSKCKLESDIHLRRVNLPLCVSQAGLMNFIVVTKEKVDSHH